MGRLPRRPGCAVLTIVLSATLLAAGLHFGRDLPRRWLEARLGAAAGGDVSLRGLDIEARDRFVLHDLVTTRPAAFPGLARLEIERLVVTAGLGELRRDVIRDLRLDGVVATLDGAGGRDGDAGSEGAGPPPIDVRRLTLRNASVLTPVAEPARLDVDLRRDGAAWLGEVRMRAPSMDLGAVLALLPVDGLGAVSGRADGLSVDAQLRSEADGGPLAAVRADRVAARDDARGLAAELRQLSVDVGGPAAEALVADVRAGQLDLAINGEGAAASVPDLTLRAELERGRWRVEGRSAVFDALRAELDPGGAARLGVEGLRTGPARVRGVGVDAVDASVTLGVTRTGASGPPALELSGRLEQVTTADGAVWSVPGAVLDLTARLADAGRPTVDLSLQLPAFDGPMPPAVGDWLPLALPVSVAARGELFLDASRFTGDAELRSPAAGGVTLTGDMPFAPDAAGLDAGWRLDVTPRAIRDVFERVQLPGDVALHAEGLRAAGRVRGSLLAPELTGRANLDDLEINAVNSFGAAFWGPLSLEFRATPAGGGWRLDATDVEAEGAVGSPILDDQPVAVRGNFSLRIDGPEGRLALDLRDVDTQLGDGGALGTVGVNGRVADDHLQLAVAARDVDLAAWQRTLNIGLGDVDVKGIARLEGQLDGGGVDGPGLHAVARLQLDEFGASAGGGARVMEGLGGRVEITASRAAADGRLRAEARGELGGFLVLWDAYFGDLSELATDVKAHFDTGVAGQAGDFTAGVTLRPRTSGESTTLSAELGRTGGRLRAAGTVESLDLEDLRDGLLRPFQTADPLLRHLAGSATLRAELDVEAPGAPAAAAPAAAGARLRGRFTSRGVEVEIADASLRDLHADIPFDIRRRAGDVDGPALAGELRLGASAVGGLAVPPVRSALDIRGDGVALLEPLEIDVLGGRLTLERLALRSLLVEPTAEAGVELQGLSMERLTQALGLPSLEGQLDGSLPRLTLDRNRLLVDGGGRLRLFGGEVRLRDITGEEIFTPFPRLRVSADIDGLDLGAVTRRFDFGEMRGLVSGFVDDAVLVGGAPVAFDARLESVDRAGVAQTVDVKAVQNLTVLGTGASPTLFDRGLQRFLKRYRYRKLGFRVKLRDDLLEIRGLVQDGDRELFMQGGGLFGIDVVNAAPGQRVSYSAMLRRLENLDVGDIRLE